jgi:HSP20 family molecular chaperone IbpA
MTSVNLSEHEARKGSENGGQHEIAATRDAVELPPPVDIYENRDELLLVVDLPGVAPESVKVDFDAPELKIRAERAANGGSIAYYRAFRVDERIDPNGIDAELKGGVLSVHLKKSADLKPRRVAVKAD